MLAGEPPCRCLTGLRARGPSWSGPAALCRHIFRWERGCWGLAHGPGLGWPGSKEAAMATRAGHRDASAGTGGETVTAAVPQGGPFKGQRLLKLLVGSGDKIGLFILPFLLVGLVLNIVYPSAFDVGGPSAALRVVSIVVLIPGL